MPSIMSTPARLRLLLLAFTAALAFAASASAQCDPGRGTDFGNWLSGWVNGPDYNNGNCLDGSQANILVYQPFIDTLSGTTYSSSAWTMIDNNLAPWNAVWAQVGWEQFSDRNKYFTETHNSDWPAGARTVDHYKAGSSDLGDSPSFKVTYTSGTQMFHFFTFDFNWDNVSNNEAYTGCYTSQAGELTNYSNQMAGGYNNHAYVESSEVHRVNDVWKVSTTWTPQKQASDGTTAAPPVDAGDLKINSTRLEIWDKECSS